VDTAAGSASRPKVAAEEEEEEEEKKEKQVFEQQGPYQKDAPSRNAAPTKSKVNLGAQAMAAKADEKASKEERVFENLLGKLELDRLPLNGLHKGAVEEVMRILRQRYPPPNDLPFKRVILIALFAITSTQAMFEDTLKGQSCEDFMDAAKTHLGDRTRMETIIKNYNLIREDVNEMLARMYPTQKSKKRRLTKVREPQAPIQSMYKPNERRNQPFLIIRTRTLRHLADLPDDDARNAYKATQEYNDYVELRDNTVIIRPPRRYVDDGSLNLDRTNEMNVTDKETLNHYKTHKVSAKVVDAFNREVAEELAELNVRKLSPANQVYDYDNQRQAAAKDAPDEGSPAESKRKVPAALRPPRASSSSKPSRKASAASMYDALYNHLAPQQSSEDSVKQLAATIVDQLARPAVTLQSKRLKELVNGMAPLARIQQYVNELLRPETLNQLSIPKAKQTQMNANWTAIAAAYNKNYPPPVPLLPGPTIDWRSFLPAAQFPATNDPSNPSFPVPMVARPAPVDPLAFYDDTSSFENQPASPRPKT
jgi:hypothetical protein